MRFHALLLLAALLLSGCGGKPAATSESSSTFLTGARGVVVDLQGALAAYNDTVAARKSGASLEQTADGLAAVSLRLNASRDRVETLAAPGNLSGVRDDLLRAAGELGEGAGWMSICARTDEGTYCQKGTPLIQEGAATLGRVDDALRAAPFDL